MKIMNTSNCDVSTIFSGGGPNSAGALVEINGTQLIPSPFVRFNLEKYRMGDLVIGGVLRLTLNGTVVGNSFNDVAVGLNDILDLGKNSQCVSVLIKCQDKLIDGYGRIISVSTEEGNQPTWVNMAPYTIEIELYSNNGEAVVDADEFTNSPLLSGIMLKNISESLSFSINEDTFNWGNTCEDLTDYGIKGFGNKHIKLNFNINVAGILGCGTGDIGGKEYGLKAAETYLINRLTDLHSGGSLNILDITNYKDAPNTELSQAVTDYFKIDGSPYMDFRNISINPIDNSIEVSGDIIYIPSGCQAGVFTTLNVENQLNVDGETITIAGSIQGLSSHDFSEIITLNNNEFADCSLNQKLTNAENFLSKINDTDVLKLIANCYNDTKGYLTDNCQYSATIDDCSTQPTQPTPLPSSAVELCDLRLISSQVSRNISGGEINFTFTLSNTANCEILGARKVNVEITHDIPHDTIAEIIIPGRGSKGPLIQNICCESAEKYDITVDATLNKKTCTFDVKKTTIDQLRQCADKALQDLIDDQAIDVNCWFKTNDQETIGNTTYRLNRSYVKPSCP